MSNPARSARQVHPALLDALDRMRRAEECAVLHFAEILKRKLFRKLGYPSIAAYAAGALQFTPNKTREFIRLAEALDELPVLRRAVKRQAISWTKARTLSRVASPETEQAWLAVAAKSSCRELEAKVKQARKAQPEEAPGLFAPPAEPAPLPAPKSSVGFILAPEQRARLEACLERLRKRGERRSREELLLAAFDALLAEAELPRQPLKDDDSHDSDLPDSRRASRDAGGPPYQIVVYRCERCGDARLPGGEVLRPAVAEAAACDCRLQVEGKPNRASIPPAKRRQALVRDRHRCSLPGCGSTRFLEVHHLGPRAQGGGNGPENLITLCSACHRLAHEKPQALARLGFATAST